MGAPLPKLQQIPQSAASVADYELLARDRMTEQAWAYLAGGAMDEITLRENNLAFQRLQLRTRVLQDLSGGSTRLELFGQSFASPIFLAPVAYQKLFHPDGESATAVAASAAAVGMVVSTQASVSLEEIAQQTTAPLWFQLYVQPDRGFTRDLVQRAQGAGYRALMVTVDAPVSGIRNREQRAGFRLPTGVAAVNLRGMRPLSAQRNRPEDGMLLGGALLDSAPTWRDIEWLRSLTSLPVLIKGVMTAEDAKRAIEERIDGIVVSNHGGRTLDTQPPAIEVLPEIAEAVGGRLPLLMDGGIRRGSDVFKALALGANAVLVGRPYVYGLAAAGAAGICHVMNILRAELEVTMALTGCSNLTAVCSALIRNQPGFRIEGRAPG